MNHSTNRHREYTAMSPIWQRCRDARMGEDAVKAKGETYLPKLGGQTETQYNAYKLRSRFFNAFNKTITGHVGLATRKPILIEYPDSLEPIIKNVDRKGSDVTGYLKSVLGELLEVGRTITLIDYTKLDIQATMADTGDARPYWIQYKVEDFLDWEYKDGVLVYGVLREVRDDQDRHAELKYQYRVCKLVEGVYIQELFNEDSNEPIETITPKVANNNLNFVPIVVHQVNYDACVDLPPLLDLVNLCMSYYRLKADHAHALHYAALPTPYIIGINSDSPGAPKTIGPHQIWYITSPDASVGMLEFTGAGVEAIEKELDKIEDQMAIVGARILLPEVSENTATASTLRSISETSDLSSVVIILERQASMMLEFTAIWAGAAGESGLNWSKHFIPKEMDASMVLALVTAWQSEGFDRETLVENFKRAEIVDPAKTLEELQKATDKEGAERTARAAEAMKALEDASPGDEEEEDD